MLLASGQCNEADGRFSCGYPHFKNGIASPATASPFASILAVPSGRSRHSAGRGWRKSGKSRRWVCISVAYTDVGFFPVRPRITEASPCRPCRASARGHRLGQSSLHSRLQPGFSIQWIHPVLATKTEPRPIAVSCRSEKDHAAARRAVFSVHLDLVEPLAVGAGFRVREALRLPRSDLSLRNRRPRALR